MGNVITLDYTPHKLSDIDSILLNCYSNGVTYNNKKIGYYNIIAAFDIETTSFIDNDSPDSNNKRGMMYVWQFAINGHVIIGRFWHEFIELCEHISSVLELDNKCRLLVYVHNLAFEYQWLSKLFKWSKVFATAPRKPIYALNTLGIEFRCSYILTNYSLAKLAEQLHMYKINKLVGDLDYSKTRTPLTPLDENTELKYCIHDVLIISAYIQECIITEGNITKIPLTCTGYCRRFVRYNCLYSGKGSEEKKKQQQHYYSKMQTMKISGVEEYNQLKRAFAGGFTHAAAKYSGYILHDCDSIDFTSSYPYVLLSEQFPMSSGELVEIKSVEEIEHYLKYYCCIFDCEFHDIKASFKYENYISISKCFNKKNVINNNGRLYSADNIGITLTDVDFEIIRKTYKFKSCKVWNFRIYKKGYLPIEIIKSIIKLYSDKTTLKGVMGKETEYLISKGLLNSVY